MTMDAAHQQAHFFASLDRLVASGPVVVDRPRGTRHPVHHEAVYPVDYGYVDGTRTVDGEGVDVFRGTATGTGTSCALVVVDEAKREVELKIVLDCTRAEVDAVTGFVRDSLHLPCLRLDRA